MQKAKVRAWVAVMERPFRGLLVTVMERTRGQRVMVWVAVMEGARL